MSQSFTGIVRLEPLHRGDAGHFSEPQHEQLLRKSLPRLVSNLLIHWPMASARPFQLLRCAIIFALTAASGHALQLGENEAQITARHGAPSVEDHGRHLAVYFWEGWSAQLEFKDGVVDKLTYRRNTYLEEAEIQSLLQANGGANRWHETTNLATKAREWIRDDGAVAVSDSARPTGMIFQTGVATAEAIVTDTFLKFEAPASPPALQPMPATPRNEPVVRSNAPLPQLRSEPQLRADETLTEIFAPAPEPPPAAAVESAKPRETPAPIAPSAAAIETAVAEVHEPSGGMGRLVFGIIFIVGLIAAALFYFLAKRRRSRVGTALRAVRGERSEAVGAGSSARTARSAVPTSQPTPMPASDEALDLDSLRADQIELLLGEIFRRQGYTVELSAALGTDGGSDLTLRRDGESIPVQSKDWKAARVTEQEIRGFYAVMAGTAAPRGVFVTTGTFSREARELAAEKSIELIDRAGLAQRIAAVRRPGENFFDVTSWIDDFTAYARIFDPECPCCAQAMVIRHHRADGTAHWACVTHPRCAGKRETRRDLLTLPAAA